MWSTLLTACAAVLAVLCVVDTGEAARILLLAPISTKSFKSSYTPVAKALASRGHQVTFVTPFKNKKETKNVNEVIVTELDIKRIVPNVFKSGGTTSHPLVLLGKVVPEFCADGLALPQIQALLQEDFDIILLSAFMSDCFLVFHNHFKVPLIYLMPAGLSLGTEQIVGNPVFASFMPNLMSTFTDQMSFGQRIINTLQQTLMPIVVEKALVGRMDTVARARGLLPENAPSLNDLRLNASLIILNSIKSTEFPTPYMPNVIHAGGINCLPAEKLPKDLEEWVEGSGEDGFIFFSLGSAIQTEDMPEELRILLVKVFGSLKQRVLWKWETEQMPDLPSNVKLGKWLPQQDLLGHPKIKLFISHGGLHSTIEATYHAVPVLGLPLAGDQFANLLRVEAEGAGKALDWHTVTEDQLRNTIRELVDDKSFQKRLSQRSAIMQDRLVSPTDEAVYWIEYILRHNGAHHLRSPSRFFPLWKLYNMDVWGVLFGGFALILLGLSKCCCYCGRKCCGKPKSKLD